MNIYGLHKYSNLYSQLVGFFWGYWETWLVRGIFSWRHICILWTWGTSQLVEVSIGCPKWRGVGVYWIISVLGGSASKECFLVVSPQRADLIPLLPQLHAVEGSLEWRQSGSNPLGLKFIGWCCMVLAWIWVFAYAWELAVYHLPLNQDQ